MLTAAAALATELQRLVMVSESLAATLCWKRFVGGTALRVFFWCVVVAGYFLVGIQQRHRVVR